MIVKQNETHRFWCPMARVYNPCYDPEGRDIPVAYNRHVIDDGGDPIGAGGGVWSDRESACVGEACMAWRKVGRGLYDNGAGVHEFQETGYCGLAGKLEEA